MAALLFHCFSKSNSLKIWSLLSNVKKRTVVLRSAFDVEAPPLDPLPPRPVPLPRVVAFAGAFSGDGTTLFDVIESLLLKALAVSVDVTLLFLTPRVSNIYKRFRKKRIKQSICQLQDDQDKE